MLSKDIKIKTIKMIKAKNFSVIILTELILTELN